MLQRIHADLPIALHAGEGRSGRPQFAFNHRHASRYNVAADAFKGGGDFRHDVREAPTDVRMHGGAINLRQPLVHPDIAQLSIQETEPDRRGRIEALEFFELFVGQRRAEA